MASSANHASFRRRSTKTVLPSSSYHRPIVVPSSTPPSPLQPAKTHTSSMPIAKPRARKAALIRPCLDALGALLNIIRLHSRAPDARSFHSPPGKPSLAVVWNVSVCSSTPAGFRFRGMGQSYAWPPPPFTCLSSTVPCPWDSSQGRMPNVDSKLLIFFLRYF